MFDLIGWGSCCVPCPIHPAISQVVFFRVEKFPIFYTEKISQTKISPEKIALVCQVLFSLQNCKISFFYTEEIFQTKISPEKSLSVRHSVLLFQCTMRYLYSIFCSRPNKLGHTLKVAYWYII